MDRAHANAAALAACGPDPDWYLDHVLLDQGRIPTQLNVDTQMRRWRQWWAGQADRLRGGTATDPVATSQLAATQLAATQGFVVTHAQARASGLSQAELRRLLYAGTWWAARRGVVAVVQVPSPPASDDSAVRLAARRMLALRSAAAALANPGQTLSGTSAAVLHGMPVFSDPSTPQLTAARTRTAGNLTNLSVRPASLRQSERTSWFGLPVTTPARTLVDLARHDRRDGLIAADAALRDGRLTRAAISRALEAARGWPGVRQARDVLALADPLAESALESITRLACHDSGLPPPELQAQIADPGHNITYRVDGLWRGPRLILEADGRLKYTGDELWKEKRRQERLTRLGYQVLRVSWADVVHAWPETLDRLRHALAACPSV